MSKKKKINRCEIDVEARPTNGNVSMGIYCTVWTCNDDDDCLFYESRTKDGCGECKFKSNTRYARECKSPKALKATAKKIIAALKKNILSKEG